MPSSSTGPPRRYFSRTSSKISARRHTSRGVKNLHPPLSSSTWMRCQDGSRIERPRKSISAAISHIPDDGDAAIVVHGDDAHQLAVCVQLELCVIMAGGIAHHVGAAPGSNCHGGCVVKDL